MNDYSIKSIRQQFKNAGVFYTPPALAEMLRSLVPGTARRVYDPTCGRGNLLAVFPDEVQKFGQDIDAEAIADARVRLNNFTGAVGDLFTQPAFQEEKFDAIVANPPFSVKWEPQADERFMLAPTVPTAGKADYAFLLHILHMLSDEGVAAVLNFPGVLYRGNREAVIRRWLVEQNFIDRIIHIPGGTFTDTSISTVCLVLQRQRESESIVFEDREHSLSREVGLAEIAANDFVLSVSLYVAPEAPEPEPVDFAQLEVTARSGAIRSLMAHIQMAALMESITGMPAKHFVADIKAALDIWESG